MALLSHEKGPNLCKKMGRRPKATILCINNLGHAQKKLQAQVKDIMNPQAPYFEGNPSQNCSIDLLEEGFFMLDKDLDSDDEDETEDEECKDESMDKPVTNADIVAFTQILGKAQLAAVKAEHITTAEKLN
jgi:hypothetical protein